MLDPRRLLTFGEVARRGSFSRAAEALALTQPAVSQQVAALERQLGMRLLDRGPGGPTPTEAGALLLAHADAIAGRLAQADAQIAELAAGAEAALHVGAFPSALGSVLPAAIARLRAQRPELQIEAREGSAQENGAAVATGGLHVAVCFQDTALPPHHPDGTERHELGEEPMLAMLPAGHRLAGRRSIPLAALAEETWTAPSREHLVHRACVAAGFEPRIAYISRDPLAIGELVAGGLAVTLAPQLLAGRLQGVALVPLDDAVPRRALYALTPAAGARPSAGAFVAELAAALADVGGIDPAPQASRGA
jgi:DNA-binding transcriptional LysR family regulator